MTNNDTNYDEERSQYMNESFTKSLMENQRKLDNHKIFNNQAAMSSRNHDKPKTSMSKRDTLY